VALVGTELATHWEFAPSTVQYTLNQESARKESESKPQAGELTARRKRIMICLIQLNPFISYGDIQWGAKIPVTDSLVKDLCHEVLLLFVYPKRCLYNVPVVASPRVYF
jgi:hypothetical protein